jgi:small GTP-binding protein
MSGQQQQQQHEVGIIVVGDLKSGKSTLIQRFIHGATAPSAPYKPTSFDKFYAGKRIGPDRVGFTIWDTSGAPAYDTVRPLAYRQGWQ